MPEINLRCLKVSLFLTLSTRDLFEREVAFSPINFLLGVRDSGGNSVELVELDLRMVENNGFEMVCFTGRSQLTELFVVLLVPNTVSANDLVSIR